MGHPKNLRQPQELPHGCPHKLLESSRGDRWLCLMPRDIWTTSGLPGPPIDHLKPSWDAHGMSKALMGHPGFPRTFKTP